MKGEVLKDKPRRTLTRPGRLRARSGSKLPEATGPLRALGMVDSHGQGAWDCLRVLCEIVHEKLQLQIAIPISNYNFLILLYF